jgi:membrane protein DedA with SNARE-associated domain
VSEEPIPAPADLAAPAEAVTADNDTVDNDTGDNDAGDKLPDDPWNDPRLPWEGKPRRVDVLLWLAITVTGLYYLALIPFRASLVGTHPLTLVLLNGSTEGIISAAAFAHVNHGSIPLVLLTAVFGLMKFDIIYWWAGRLWGERIILLLSGQGKKKSARGPRFIARVHRWGWKFTWPAVLLAPFTPIPSPLLYAVAGWAGMSWVTFLLLDLVSELAWAGMLAGLGYSLGHHAVVVAQEISKYGLWVSIAIVVLVVVGQMRGNRAKR